MRVRTKVSWARAGLMPTTTMPTTKTAHATCVGQNVFAR